MTMPTLVSRLLTRVFPLAVAFALNSACVALAEDSEPHEPSGSFSFSEVQARALELAQNPFAIPEKQVPGALLNLKAEQWRSIHFNPAHTLWRSDSLGFTVELCPPGALYNRLVWLNEVVEGESRPLTLQPDMFDAPDLSPEVRQALTVSGLAGFRIFYPLQTFHSRDEIAHFLGASFFQGLGRRSANGVQARGLSLNTARSEGEEFPYFREFWLVRPASGEQRLTVYALLDSPGMAGAYEFVIEPGTSTIMDVRCNLYPRGDVLKAPRPGIAPLDAMFLSSETKGAFPGDYRPEVHQADGLLVSASDGWCWRPLKNGQRLAVHAFGQNDMHGFGLLQRDNDFDHYQDIAARFERGSSLWVEPVGDWGAGHVELVEIPTKSDIHRNITAFWVPDTPATVGNMAFSYRLYWLTPGVTPHTLGKAVSTRVASLQDGSVRFVVDFASEALSELPAETGLTAIMDLPSEVALLEKQILKNPVTGGWRLMFLVRMPAHDSMVQTILSAREGGNSLRMRAFLKRGENIPEPLTETWVYDYEL